MYRGACHVVLRKVHRILRKRRSGNKQKQIAEFQQRIIMEQYEEQLRQIQLALENVQNEVDRRNLQSLENDLKQLISLTFLESLEGDEPNLSLNESAAEEDGKLVSASNIVRF